MLKLKLLNLEFKYLCFKPKVDLFATNINTQSGKYAAIRRDPGAMYIEAYTIDWSYLRFHAFSPISSMPNVFSNVKHDSEEGILVVPLWLTQVWFPVMIKILISTPIILNPRKLLPVQPQAPKQVHPMWEKISMLVAHFSGSLQKANHCQEMLLMSYQLHGEWEQERSRIPISKGVSS